MPALTQQQIADYKETGYTVIRNAIEPDLLHRLQSTTHELIDQSRHVHENNDVYDLDVRHTEQAPRLNRIKTPHLVHAVYDELLRSNAMLSLLEPLLGKNIRLHNSKLNTKASNGGTAVHWHQDWAFYPHTNDDLLAIGVMLSDIAEEDGPLQVVPGSHKGPVLPHDENGTFCGAVNPTHPEAQIESAVTLTGKAGDISFHHVRALHGSAPNYGENPRLLLLYEVGACDAWPINGAQNAYTGLSQSALWQRFTENTICGEQSVVPRMTNVPVVMPVPPPPDATSIFAVQKSGGAIDSFNKL